MPLERTLAHLSRLYETSDDPWSHRTSPTEAAKYDATLAALPARPYAHLLEVGCGNGTLARRLAPRGTCMTLIDPIPRAIEAARVALESRPFTQFITGAAPAALPAIRPDLTILSEVLYFMTPEEISDLADWLVVHRTGPVVAVNWTGPTDEDLDGTRAVEILAAALAPRARDHRTRMHDGFRIDRFD